MKKYPNTRFAASTYNQALTQAFSSPYHQLAAKDKYTFHPHSTTEQCQILVLMITYKVTHLE